MTDKKLTTEQLLYDCYNQWAYESKKGLWNGGLSVLEDIEELLEFKSPIKREDFWALRDAHTAEDECICNLDPDDTCPVKIFNEDCPIHGYEYEKDECKQQAKLNARIKNEICEYYPCGDDPQKVDFCPLQNEN